MKKTPRLPCALLSLSLVSIPTAASAQLCFEIFEDLKEPTMSCADAFYGVDQSDGELGFQQFGDSSTGILGTDFNGFDLFDPIDPELAPPDNLHQPFFADTQFSTGSSGGQINELRFRQRAGINLGPRDSSFQQASAGSRSRLTFIPFTRDGDTAPVFLDVRVVFDFSLSDPKANAGGGATIASGRVVVTDTETLEPLFDFSGLAELELDFNEEPSFFGDFEDDATFEPSGPGIDDEFDIDIENGTTFQATPGRPLVLESDTFGSIFTDGFESGDTSAWSYSSGDTFEASITSSDPNVRFRIVTADETEDINYGHSGSWYNEKTSGQGFLLDIQTSDQFMFVANFTFDTISPQDGGIIPGAEHRWLTAQGNYSGNRAELTIFQTRNGVFDDTAPVNTQPVGTMIIEFISCTEAVLTYELPGLNLSGVIPLTKLLTDEICTKIANGEISEAKRSSRSLLQDDEPQINFGMTGAWFNPQTDGQGVLFDFLPENDFMFVAAFTWDLVSPQEGGNIPGAEQRWFTAQGNYMGNRAELTIFQTRNGVFDDPAPVETLPVGTMVVEFMSCTAATLTYDLPALGLSASIELVKILADELCTQINDGTIVLAE